MTTPFGPTVLRRALGTKKTKENVEEAMGRVTFGSR
jgi:hypothetical protein